MARKRLSLNTDILNDYKIFAFSNIEFKEKLLACIRGQEINEFSPHV